MANIIPVIEKPVAESVKADAYLLGTQNDENNQPALYRMRIGDVRAGLATESDRVALQEQISALDTSVNSKAAQTSLAAAEKRLDNLIKVSKGDIWDEQADETVAYKKIVPAGAQEWAMLNSLGGRSIVWNQLLDKAGYAATKAQYGVTFTNQNDGTYHVTGTSTDATVGSNISLIASNPPTVVKGRKYLIVGVPSNVGNWDKCWSILNVYGIPPEGGNPTFGTNGRDYGGTYSPTSNLFTADRSGAISVTLIVKPGAGAVDFYYKPMLFDLTLMFGAGNEPATIADFKAMFTSDLYPYCAPTIKHIKVNKVSFKATPEAAPIVTNISSDVQGLAGYGTGVGTARNTVDFEKKTFTTYIGSLDLGSLTWIMPEIGTFGVSLPTDIKPYSNDVTPNYLCTKYVSKSYSSAALTDKYVTTNLGAIIIKDTAYSTPEAFKTAMAGVMFYYELSVANVADISQYVTNDNYIETAVGGTLTFDNTDNYIIPVKSKIDYMIELGAAI